MDETETSVKQRTPSDLEVLLPFYFVKLWPKDVDPKSRIKEAVKLFEEMDKRHFHMSEKIRRKLFEWEEEVSILDDLKYYHWEVLRKIQIQTSRLAKLNLELHNLCSASGTRRRRTTKSEFTIEQGADIHKLNFLMLHPTKNLSEENRLLRDMNFRQQREVAAISPLHAYNEADERKSTKSTTLKGKDLNPKISNKSIRKTIEDVCDELMEMRKEKKALEAKIKKAEKISGAIGKEIRSRAKQSKDKQHRKEAYFCMLDQRRIYNEECWVLQYRNLESVKSCMIYMDKSSSTWAGGCRNWMLSYNINCL